jgi:predicted adenine nucleotide alpha hydrolase (AANH) superfamily ATPase
MHPTNKKKMLLHACCAPCSPHVIELLRREFKVAIFFYNPNIHPLEEYQRRLQEIQNFCRKQEIELTEGKYETDNWFSLIKGLEDENEGGKRCILCYQMRLAKTAHWAQVNDYTHFSTTLTISPHKKATVINQIGRELQKKHSVVFYEADFKKQDGFKKSCELSKQFGFYRQNYCGCMFSKTKKNR